MKVHGAGLTAVDVVVVVLGAIEINFARTDVCAAVSRALSCSRSISNANPVSGVVVNWMVGIRIGARAVAHKYTHTHTVAPTVARAVSNDDDDDYHDACAAQSALDSNWFVVVGAGNYVASVYVAMVIIYKHDDSS